MRYRDKERDRDIQRDREKRKGEKEKKSTDISDKEGFDAHIDASYVVHQNRHRSNQKQARSDNK